MKSKDHLPKQPPISLTIRDSRIDVLRGISILLVLLHHFHLAYRLGPSLLYSNGNYAVIVFFVISGYLITSTSIRRFGSLRAISLRRFYSFRFARIYPCLLLVLLAITVPGVAGVHRFANNKPVSWLLADLSVLTFWHNILMARLGWFNYCLNVLWSLSVEEVFYLLFPLLSVLLRKDWLVVLIWIAAIFYAPVYRAQHAHDEIQFLLADFSCFDAIALGCCAAFFARGRTVSVLARNLWQLFSAMAMVGVFFHSGIWANVFWGPTLMAAGTAVFLWAQAASRSHSSWITFPIEWFGRHSYELYLFHIVILAVMRNLYETQTLPPIYKWPWFAAYLLLSSATAWAIARWYSEPLNQSLRRRLTSPQRSSSAVAVAL